MVPRGVTIEGDDCNLDLSILKHIICNKYILFEWDDLHENRSNQSEIFVRYTFWYNEQVYLVTFSLLRLKYFMFIYNWKFALKM